VVAGAAVSTRRNKNLEAQWFGDRFYVALYKRRWGLFDLKSEELKRGEPVLLKHHRVDVTSEARRRGIENGAE